MQLQANNVRLNAFERPGAEPALVFLHHWGGSSRTWTEVITALTVKNRILAIDLRGWGDSDRPSRGYDIKTLADDAIAAIRAAKSEQYVLVGHSMGGKVSQLLATRRPTGLLGLVLVAPSPAGGVKIPTAQRDAMLGAYESVDAIEATLKHVLTARPLTEDQRQRAIEDSLHGCIEAKRAWPSESIAEDVSRDINRINVPTLVIGASEDGVDPPEMLETEVRSKIVGATLQVIAGSGHLLPLEAPAELARLIDEFCTSLGESPISAT